MGRVLSLSWWLRKTLWRSCSTDLTSNIWITIVGIHTSVMLCLWWYVFVLCHKFHPLHSAFMWWLGVSVIHHWQLAVTLRYYVFLLSVMARYDGRIMHTKDKSALVMTLAHCPITVLVAAENNEYHAVDQPWLNQRWQLINDVSKKHVNIRKESMIVF